MQSDRPAYKVVGDTLHLEKGVRVSFEYPIAEVMECGPVLVVRLEAPHEGEPCNNNVCGVSREGHIVWEAPVMEWVTGNSPYTALFRSEEDDLVGLFNYSAFLVFLDPCSGKCIRHENVGW